MAKKVVAKKAETKKATVKKTKAETCSPEQRNAELALENARLFDETQRLFKAEQERVAELQIINSIQQGLAAELDFQAIVDLVGDKLREVFNTKDFGIRWYDEKTNLVHFMYDRHSASSTRTPPSR